MNPNAKHALLKQLLGIAEHMKVNPHDQLTEGLSWSQPDGRVFHLPEPWAQEVRDHATRLSNQSPWNERFTDKYLRKRLSLVLIQSHDSGKDAASKLLDNMVEEFDAYSIERRIFVPITGINLVIPDLKIGQVVLRRFGDERFEQFSSQLDGVSQDHLAEPPQEVGGFKDLAKHNLFGKVCAEFTTVAEPDRAFERAKEQTRRAVELVTFACIALLPADAPQANVIIGLEGEVPRIGPWTLSISEGEINSSHSAPISAMPITIGTGSIEGLRRVGAIALSDLLARPDHELINWERSLIRAVHWLATSQTQVELQNRLLNLITAIETVLTENRGGITVQVAESLALLIGHSFEERMQIKCFVSNMYGARSAVSHGGKKSLIESDVSKLRGMVARMITTLVSHRDQWNSKNQLNDWLERKRLGG